MKKNIESKMIYRLEKDRNEAIDCLYILVHLLANQFPYPNTVATLDLQFHHVVFSHANIIYQTLCALYWCRATPQQIQSYIVEAVQNIDLEIGLVIRDTLIRMVDRREELKKQGNLNSLWKAVFHDAPAF